MQRSGGDEAVFISKEHNHKDVSSSSDEKFISPFHYIYYRKQTSYRKFHRIIQFYVFHPEVFETKMGLTHDSKIFSGIS